MFSILNIKRQGLSLLILFLTLAISLYHNYALLNINLDGTQKIFVFPEGIFRY